MSNTYSHKRSKQTHGLRTLFLALCLSLFAGAGYGGQVTLSWDAATDPGLAGYKLYYGSQSRSYALYIDVGNQTTFTIPDLQSGATYYIAATAYDGSGTESDYSNEVTYNAQDSCTYAISPASQSFGASGGTGTVAVATQAGCGWSASGMAWMTITSGASGTGSGSVSYTVATNTGASPRTGATSIAGQVLTLTQAAADPVPAPSYTITASAATGGTISPPGSVAVSRGASQTFAITANSGYKIKSVQVDGTSLRQPTSSYTFSNVTTNHSIKVTFSALSTNRGGGKK